MSLTSGGLMAALFMSTIGLGIFIYGRKQRRAPQFVAGVLLMLYPYLLSTALAVLAVGSGIIFLLWLALRAGW